MAKAIIAMMTVKIMSSFFLLFQEKNFPKHWTASEKPSASGARMESWRSTSGLEWRTHGNGGSMTAEDI
jgi:hypothetical protein